MINRTLIRLKVVQMLYSYMLTRSEFRLAPPPERRSRDVRAAYALYLDMMLLIMELSGYNVKNGRKNPLEGLVVNTKLTGSKMAKSLSIDSDVREVILKGETSIDAFDDLIPELYEIIVNSEAFKDYSKKRTREIKDDVAFWIIIVKTVFAKNDRMIAAARTTDPFTRVGYDNAINMVIDTLSNYSDTKTNFIAARNSLDTSLAKAYELYHSLLLLTVEITKERRARIEAAKEKFVPTDEDLNPNMRFVNNEFVKEVEESEVMSEYVKSNPISWEGDVYLIRNLLDDIQSSDIYKEYMEAETTTFADDCELWRQLMKNVILPSDSLEEALESKSVFWNDDLDIMGTFVLKTIKQWGAAGSNAPGLLPMYKDDEDAAFGASLFVDSVKNRELYRSYVEKFIDTDQWDPERIAFMDVVIMTAIISELVSYPQIPVPVTLNEYIEIANRYSTPKSGQFINGVIYNVIKLLKEEGKIQK